jgi:peptide/nickel transport system ATP-binding protein/oligopeptide transport system ATP-binding protein
MSGKDGPLLELRDLRVRFRTLEGVLTAVDGVSFSVLEGETVGLVGESGCGKSVTALSILRLLRCPPAIIEGEIRFLGQNLLELDKEAIRRIRGNSISMIFQEPMTSLNPLLMVGEQISEGVRIHKGLSRKEAWRVAVDMLRRVRIPNPGIRAREYPHMMSGGMRQRSVIAMALACEPKLILADEPTTALDVTIQAQILDLMIKLKEDFNSSVLLITHDLGVIAEMASRVVVMYAGKVVEEAPVNELFQDPRHPYTQGLLGCVPVIGRKYRTGGRLREIPGVVPSLLQMPPGCRFHPRCQMAMEICSREEPPAYRISDQRQVACWLEGGK